MLQLGAVEISVLLSALVTGLLVSAGIAGWLPPSPVLGAMLVVSFILVMLSTWLSNVRALNR